MPRASPAGRASGKGLQHDLRRLSRTEGCRRPPGSIPALSEHSPCMRIAVCNMQDAQQHLSACIAGVCSTPSVQPGDPARSLASVDTTHQREPKHVAHAQCSTRRTHSGIHALSVRSPSLGCPSARWCGAFPLMTSAAQSLAAGRAQTPRSSRVFSAMPRQRLGWSYTAGSCTGVISSLRVAEPLASVTAQ